MASGALGGDEPRDKKRPWEDGNKVYSRKTPKKPKNSHNVPKTKPKTQTLTLTEDNNYSASPPRDASDDDSSSHIGNVYRRFSLNSIRKSEVRELKRKLVTELDQVRGFIKKLQAKEQEKEKPNHDQRRTAPNPNNVKKKTKKLKSNVGSVVELDWHLSPVFKTCSDLLTRLMKHKFGWVFNKPVDVKGLGLHDYHTIVKHPMDLGTVKTRLDKNWYKSPREFAEDVRLTFGNAMLYNPKGQDVHFMAEQLSKIYEDQWKPIEAEINNTRRVETNRNAGLPTPTSRKTPMLNRAEMRRDAALPTPTSRKTPMLPRAHAPAPTPAPAPPPRLPSPPPPPPPPPVEMRTLERSESRTMTEEPKSKPPGYGQLGRTSIPKKPKAKDPDKRDMTYEEKQRLSSSLQSLPSEKLDNIVQIIKKRHSALFQQDDEIEVDIASVDPETLWELDRFVTNYKKSLSKNKRKTEPTEPEPEPEPEPEAEGETDNAMPETVRP